MNRVFTSFIVAAMVLGVVVGWALNQYASPDQAKAAAETLSIVTDVFLRLIKMIIAPLVFATVVSGITASGDTKAVGRVGGKALAWFITASLVSLTLATAILLLLKWRRTALIFGLLALANLAFIAPLYVGRNTPSPGPL